MLNALSPALYANISRSPSVLNPRYHTYNLKKSLVRYQINYKTPAMADALQRVWTVLTMRGLDTLPVD